MLPSSLQARSGGPNAPKTASLGGIPSVIPDIPVCAVLMAFYIGFAAANMTILRINSRRGHKFILSGLLFGFCMARITTLVLRIAWATRQHNVRLAIAARILVNAGVLLVFIINLILAQRILRAKQPHIGWHRIERIGSNVLYSLIAGALIMVITSSVVSMYTLNAHTRSQCRKVQLAAITYLLVFTCVPLLHVLAAVMLPRSPREESFGQGRMATKVAVVTASSCLCIIIAGFKAGITWSPPRPMTNPAWYHSKAAFFVFTFVPEILVLFILTMLRFDKRFHVPNGSTKPGDYSGWTQPSSEGSEDMGSQRKTSQ